MPAVAGSLSPLWRKIRASRENGGGADSEPLGVLMQSHLQFRESRLYFVGASSGDSLSTQFSNAIIYSSGAYTHNDKIQFLREKVSFWISQSSCRIPTLYPVENDVESVLE